MNVTNKQTQQQQQPNQFSSHQLYYKYIFTLIPLPTFRSRSIFFYLARHISSHFSIKSYNFQSVSTLRSVIPQRHLQADSSTPSISLCVEATIYIHLVLTLFRLLCFRGWSLLQRRSTDATLTLEAFIPLLDWANDKACRLHLLHPDGQIKLHGIIPAELLGRCGDTLLCILCDGLGALLSIAWGYGGGGGFKRHDRIGNDDLLFMHQWWNGRMWCVLPDRLTRILLAWMKGPPQHLCERKSFLLLGYLEYRSTSRSLNSSQQKKKQASYDILTYFKAGI